MVIKLPRSIDALQADETPEAEPTMPTDEVNVETATGRVAVKTTGANGDHKGLTVGNSG